MGRVSQSNRHDNCKQRYSKSLQHRLFLPMFGNSENFYMNQHERFMNKRAGKKGAQPLVSIRRPGFARL
jgi:hypothetical protein